MRNELGETEMRAHPARGRRTDLLLLCIVGLLAVIAIELSDRLPTPVSTAVAQIPDTGLQRREIVIESRRTNELLAEILEHLRGKPVKVVIESPDKTRGDAARGR